MRQKVTGVFVSVLMLVLVTCSPATRASPSPTPSPPADTAFAPTEALQPTQGTTYYVRLDGGSASQCTGLVDAPYPGSGTGQPCAWDHPFRAFQPSGEPGVPGSVRIAGGDTLVIAAGSYMLGYGAPGADNCYADGAYECHMPPLPSGPDAAHPTRILGEGWDGGCANPPELWGAQRPWYLINLTGSDNVEIACLEITDHSSCVESHSDPSMACQRDTYPFGDWAPIGIHAEDSGNVTLHDLDIHGLASAGIHAGRLSDWTLEDVRIAGNGWVGWDGDLWEGSDANSGTLTFRRWTVEWNGCGETYPGGQPTGCWSQSAGGYGDGVGTGATGGDWIIEDSQFLYNTSDGLDLLYHTLGGQVTLRRVHAEGNAGDQIKTAGPTTAENVIAVSNCGFFEGKSFTYDVDNCRAGGSAMAFTFVQAGEQVSVVNATLSGQGDCLIITEGPDGTVRLRNDIFVGNPEFEGGGDTTCLTWYGTTSDPFDLDYAIIDGVKAYPDPCPTNSLCAVSPGLVDDSIDNFDAHLGVSSPAIDVGDGGLCPATDYAGNPRPVGAGCDLGAYEFGSGGQNQAPYPPSNPDPADSETDVPLDQTLSWQGGDPDGDPVTYTVAFGSSDPPPFASTTTSNSYTPNLVADTTYYWAITATDGMSLTPGPTWQFATLAQSPPPPDGKWALWSQGTNLRGANLYQRRVYPELDGTVFMGTDPVGPPYVQTDLNQMAEMGANYVNLSHPGLFTEAAPYSLDLEIQTNLDRLLDMALQADMFAVISFRTGPGRSEFTFFWDEVGDWFDESYLNDSVWGDQAAQDAWVDMWRYTAQRYRDHPVVIGYDLMVEPNANEVGSSVITDRLDIWDPQAFYDLHGGSLYDWNQLYPRIVSAIREVDPDTPILIGGMGYSALDWLPYLAPVSDTRAIYVVHQYTPFSYTHQLTDTQIYTYPGWLDLDWDGTPDYFDRAWLDDFLTTIDTFSHTHGVPVAVNEFGVHRWAPGAAEFMDDQMDLFQERGINHALWVWDPAWPPWAQDVDAFNFRHGPDPDNHTEVESSELMDVILDHWGRNSLRPSSAAASAVYLPLVLRGAGPQSPSPSNPLASVDDFLYQLQNLDLSAIGETAYDLVIMDYSAEGDDAGAFSPAQIAALQHSPGGDKIVLAYMSIGEAETYRFYWQESWDADGDGQPDPGAPPWLDVENPDWEGNYKVHYWDPGWQSIVFSYTDRLLSAGFDGAYLDIIDAYEYYEDQGRDTAAQDMVDFVAAIRAYAQAQDAGFYVFPQNAPRLAYEIPAYLGSLDGIGQEDIYYGYDEDDVMTPPTVTLELEGYLDLFTGADKLVLTVDYATTPDHVHDAYTKSQAKGYVPFVTVRDLDQLTLNPGHEPD